MNENMYTEGRRRKDYTPRPLQNLLPRKPPKLLTCHFCGNSWDCKNRIFLCPKCHVVFNPLKSPTIGFGGEVKVARMRANITQAELASLIGTNVMTISGIENGVEKKLKKKGKILHEKLRIWVEGTKSPIDRRKEIDNMFNFDGKEEENG